MSVSVGDTLEDAVRRIATVPGVLVLVLFAVFRLTNPVVYNTFLARGVEFALDRAGGYTLADVEDELIERGYTELLPVVDMVDTTGMDIPFVAAVGLLLTLPFIMEFLHVVGVRALAARDPNSVPVDEIVSGLPSAYVKSVVASFLALLLVVLTAPLLVGFVLAILFLFVRQRVVLDGDGVFEAMSNSYGLVKENALQMIVLVAVFWLTWVVVTFISGLVPLGDLTGPFRRTVETTVVVFGVSLFTSAYLQAVGGRAGGQPSGAPAGQSDTLGA
ncbi:hypothetical protein [Halosimplex halophilum]|uniref:hypothetical protein n=1 Tax=Halosimplex halophilum TaxID=2559572 RepID=UPI00107F0A9F|nr:hypothetical protein [Halosimplex halophilum]